MDLCYIDIVPAMAKCSTTLNGHTPKEPNMANTPTAVDQKRPNIPPPPGVIDAQKRYEQSAIDRWGASGHNLTVLVVSLLVVVLAVAMTSHSPGWKEKAGVSEANDDLRKEAQAEADWWAANSNSQVDTLVAKCESQTGCLSHEKTLAAFGSSVSKVFKAIKGSDDCAIRVKNSEIYQAMDRSGMLTEVYHAIFGLSLVEEMEGGFGRFASDYRDSTSSPEEKNKKKNIVSGTMRQAVNATAAANLLLASVCPTPKPPPIAKKK